MTLSPLQWRWSLLVQHSAWCWMQEEQLGRSLRNRPADYLQLCWELSFLNIHIFNELKRLAQHTDAVQKKKMHMQTLLHKHTLYYTGKSASCEGCWGVFARKIYCDYGLWLCDSWDFIYCLSVELDLGSFSLCHVNIFVYNMDHTENTFGSIVNNCISILFCKVHLYYGKTDFFSIISVTSADSIEWSCHFHKSLETGWISTLILFCSLLLMCQQWVCICEFINNVALKLIQNWDYKCQNLMKSETMF